MSTHAELFNDAIAETRVLLESLAASGQRTITLTPEVIAALQNVSIVVPAPAPIIAPRPVAEVAAPSAAAPAPLPPAPAARPIPAGPKEEALAALAIEVSGCTRCPLHETRTQTVFGVGNPNADLVFVGEAPGADEDRLGVPFVGRAGQLLTDIIEKGMGIPKDQVYICNVLKSHPPGNRNPRPEEMLLCEPFLIQQLDIIKPKIIVALGKTAAQCLLRSDASVGRLRGVWHDYHGIPLRVTYEPSYLLRIPSDKRLAWEDVKEILKKIRAQD